MTAAAPDSCWKLEKKKTPEIIIGITMVSLRGLVHGSSCREGTSHLAWIWASSLSKIVELRWEAICGSLKTGSSCADFVPVALALSSALEGRQGQQNVMDVPPPYASPDNASFHQQIRNPYFYMYVGRYDIKAVRLQAFHSSGCRASCY